MKTPNALPPTVITFGEPFRNASMTLRGARQVTSIDCFSIGSKAANKRENTDKYPYSLIDLWGVDDRGERHIVLRSKELRCNQKKVRSIVRATTRKLAVFLFENKQTII